MIKYFTFIFSFIFIEKIQQSSLQGYSIVLISLQFYFFWMNRCPVFLSTWSRPWTCLCFLPSLVKSWAGEWNTECLVRLLWHGLIIWPFQLPKLHNFNPLSCCVGVDRFYWSGKKVVDWFQCSQLHALWFLNLKRTWLLGSKTFHNCLKFKLTVIKTISMWYIRFEGR